MKKIVFLMLISFLIVSCRKDKNEPEQNKYSISGIVQKGPFIQGSEVRIQEFNDDLTANGSSYFTETNDDFGSFELKNEISEGYIDIATTGFYFNEIEGKLSNSLIKLKGLSYLNENKILNINILTTLAYDRIKYLISNDNLSFDVASVKAQKEVLKMFYIEIPDNQMLSFEELDLSKSGLNNSILLAISSILQFNNSEAELSELVKKMSDDIKEDGTLDSELFKTKIRESSMGLDIPSIIGNLIKRYSDLGLPTIIPNFEDYVDTDGDGVINMNETADPVFSPPSGVYTHDTIIIISVATEGASIYYTVDGSEPDTTSGLYADPIQISGDGAQLTLKAIAKHPNLDISQVVTANYSIEYPVIMPFFNIQEGTYSHDLEITLHTTQNNSTIYYTTDNSIPDMHSTRYENPIHLERDSSFLTITAIAYKDGYRSQVVSNHYLINYEPAPSPVFSKLANTYNSDILVTLSAQGGTIYYTTDGSHPTLNSPVYSSPFTIENDGTRLLIRAIAKSEHTKISYVSACYYSIDYSYDPDDYNTELTISDYQNSIVGTWIGNEKTPWINPINIEVTFRSDGTYTSKSLVPGYVAFYYGDDNEVNPYSIFDINADGSATGTLARFDGSCIGSLKYIKFSDDLNVLKFDFYHLNQNGQLRYELTRVR
jgi:hypothetical protein